MSNIHTWLSDRKRKYADGLKLFSLYAPEDMKRKLGAYFSEVDNVPPFDGHFTVLVNKLTVISKSENCAIQPLGESIPCIVSSAASIATRATDKAIDDSKAILLLSDIQKKESELFLLKDQIRELENDSEDKDFEIEELQTALDEKENEVEELHNQLLVLKPRIKVVTYSNLPENIRSIFDRAREITPLYAFQFASMQNESLTEEQRLIVAQEVYELWMERDEIWKNIDSWAQDKKVELHLEKQPMEAPESNPVLKGIQAANRIERLKENIRRTEKAILEHQKNNKLNLVQKAQEKLIAYNNELDELVKLKDER